MSLTMTFLKGVAIIGIIGMMIIALMAINYVMTRNNLPNREGTDKLRRQVDEDQEVIGRLSVFYDFLVRDFKPGKRRRHRGKHHSATVDKGR